MGGGTALTARKITTICILLKEKKSYEYIANEIGKSKNVAYSGAERQQTRRRIVKPGRKYTVSPQFKREIIRNIRSSLNERITARSFVAQNEPCIGFRLVQQLSQDSFQLSWEQMKAVLRLTDRHCSDRVAWSEKRLSENPAKVEAYNFQWRKSCVWTVRMEMRTTGHAKILIHATFQRGKEEIDL